MYVKVNKTFSFAESAKTLACHYYEGQFCMVSVLDVSPFDSVLQNYALYQKIYRNLSRRVSYWIVQLYCTSFQAAPKQLLQSESRGDASTSVKELAKS